MQPVVSANISEQLEFLAKLKLLLSSLLRPSEFRIKMEIVRQRVGKENVLLGVTFTSLLA